MLRKILLGVGALVVAVVAVLAVGLTWAHLAIRCERAPLPAAEAIVAAAAGEDDPVKLSFINTASQPMPRSVVLAPGQDPRPNEPYVMSHPSFVLEWADGRMLLVDVGMDHDGAVAFGQLIQRFGGADAIEPHAAVAERLGSAQRRVQGVIFTHLHLDHTGGITALCRGAGHPLRVFMTEAQAERPNFTTRPGLKLLRATECLRRETLTGGPLLAVPGFPGVAVIAAGGHTPGSQIVVAHVRGPAGTRTFALVGDIVNNIDGITYNIPKPFLYRLLVVPEANARLDELRLFLRDLRDRHGVTLLVSHDQRQLEQSGVPAWNG